MKKIKGYNIVKEKTNELLVSIEVGNDEVIEKDGYKVIPFYEEGNPTIEQNTGENQIEGGVVSISGSVDTFRCWKCGRTLPISERTDFAYMSNPPKYACKECEGIEKEKQYQPFKDCDELIRYHEKHLAIVTTDLNHSRPTIWVKSKRYKVDNLITAFDNDNESIGGSCVFLQDIWVDMQELFDNFTFLDNSPCGVLN